VTTTLERPATPAPEATPDERPTLRSDSWLVTILAILLAMVIGGILMALADQGTRTALGFFFQHPTRAPSYAWYTMRDAYKALFEGAIYNPANDGSAAGIFGPIAGTVYTAAPLICAALGISLAFRAGLFNIGGQGQVIAGAMAAGYVGFAWHLPVFIHLVVALVAGVAGGAFWGFIVGFLKARSTMSR
jgi:simple sugar transport system permease protein